MFGGIDPKKMQGMMKKMGIAQEEIPAKRVIIEKQDGNTIINNPAVIKINMQGQTSFQISGEVSEDKGDTSFTNPEDIATVVEKTGCKPEQAKQALEKNKGDIAEAIISLS